LSELFLALRGGKSLTFLDLAELVSLTVAIGNRVARADHVLLRDKIGSFPNDEDGCCGGNHGCAARACFGAGFH
jgi:hypothetical protein